MASSALALNFNSTVTSAPDYNAATYISILSLKSSDFNITPAGQSNYPVFLILIINLISELGSYVDWHSTAPNEAHKALLGYSLAMEIVVESFIDIAVYGSDRLFLVCSLNIIASNSHFTDCALTNLGGLIGGPSGVMRNVLLPEDG